MFFVSKKKYAEATKKVETATELINRLESKINDFTALVVDLRKRNIMLELDKQKIKIEAEKLKPCRDAKGRFTKCKK